MPGKTGILFGHFDLLHVGDLDVIRQVKERCKHVVVAVISDDLVESASGSAPIITLSERAEIVRHVRVVDQVVTVTSNTRLFELLATPDVAVFVTPSLGALLAELPGGDGTIVALSTGRQTASKVLRSALELRIAQPGSQATLVA